MIRMTTLKAALVCAAMAAIGAGAQRGAAPASDLPHVDAAAMLKAAVPDLDRRIAQFKPVKIAFDASSLTDRDCRSVAP